MTDKNDIKLNSLSDNTLMQLVGTFISHHRLEQNKTQAVLAKEAGISRSALSELEKGRRSNMITLIQVLRTLNLLHVFEQFRFAQQVSPIQLAKLEKKKRKRASEIKKGNKKPKSDW